MTAIQVIDAIKRMPSDERLRVAEFVRKLDADAAPESIDETRFKQIVEDIMVQHAPLMRKLAL